MSSGSPDGHSKKRKKGYPYNALTPDKTLAFTNLTDYEKFEALVKNGVDNVTAYSMAYNIESEEVIKAIFLYNQYIAQGVEVMKAMAYAAEQIRKMPITQSKSR